MRFIEHFSNNEIFANGGVEWCYEAQAEIKTNKQIGRTVIAAEFDAIDNKCTRSWFLVTKGHTQIPESRRVLINSIEAGRKTIPYNEMAIEHYDEQLQPGQRECLNAAASAQENHDRVMASRRSVSRDWQKLLDTVERQSRVIESNQAMIKSLRDQLKPTLWERITRSFRRSN